tara:strand:+ start:14157 stop:14870 length:714 start_codon:yes stop_codon:yes gene_type:complete
MNNKHTWRDLHNRVVDIVSQGKPQEGAISDLGDGEPVRFYPFETYEAVSQWFGDARHHAVESGQHTITKDLEEALKRWTDKDAYGVMDSLSLIDFAEFETIPKIRRIRDDEEGRVFGFVEDGDPEEYSDPIDARFRFQSMLDAFVEIAEFATKLNLSMSSEVMNKKHWSREELADFRGVKPKRITQIVSEYRRAHKEDPAWVCLHPGGKRGFKIVVQTYLSEMRAGQVGGPKRSTRK